MPVPNTPNLEQLKIRINTNNGRREVYNSESIDEKEFWPNLKVLIFEGSAGQSTIDFAEARLLQRICTHNNGNGLLHLDISKVGRNDGRGLDFRQLGLTHRLSVDEHANHMRADDWDKAPEPPTAFSDLRALRLDMLTEPEPTQKLLQLSQENGNLREFDINFPILGLGASGGEHLDFLEQFGWLQGVKSIQKLSVRDFHFDLYSDKQTEALPEFLGTFPDLQTLHIESSYHTAIQLSLLIFRIMKSCGELKVVYAPGMAGIALDKLRREGRDSYGVRVVPTPEPKSWPVPI